MKFFSLAKQKRLISFNRLTVVADRGCPSLDYAIENSLNAHLISYRQNNPSELINILDCERADVIVTNWHKIIGSDVVGRFENKLVNLHYSLLPAFPGLIGVEPIKQAINRGCRYIGPTCHLVDEGVDTGYILSQYAFPTPCEFSDAVTLMFRFGCLCLLDGVEALLNNHLTSIKLTFAEKMELFGDDFWEELAQL